MDQLSERLQTPISTNELERRWAAIRSAMENENIDVLLMQNNNDYMGGYVKYFTDLPATNGYPLTVVFPRDDLMTLISQGPFGGVNHPTANGDGVSRGVKHWFTTPSYASCHYTANYDPELAAKALAPYAGGTIGLLGTYQMSFAMVDHLQKGRFSNSRFVDAAGSSDAVQPASLPEPHHRERRRYRAPGRGFRSGRHVHGAWPHVRGRQGVGRTQGRVRVRIGSAPVQSRIAQARNTLQGYFRGL